ncbi:MAG: DUF4886 domain-containing protein [Bacteroidales bacterium]|nr:DUF4886 domain-containing protein [Bacteroidales bacterium]
MKNIRLKFMALLMVFAVCASACEKQVPPTSYPPIEQPGETEQETPEDNSTTIKILAIGNSFSVDAMEYLYGMLVDLGYEEIVLGNLYIAGCTLETHATNFQNNSASYTYYLNTTGTWNKTASYKPMDAVSSEQWDIITMQQGSPKSGQAQTYDTYLASLVTSVMAVCPDSELAWHMTWAYQATSTHSGFASYNNDQMTMYNAILNAVQTKVVPTGWFGKVIPNGTAVQNMRTSFVGDNLTRDGYHMSYDKGRYLTALGYAKALTGRDLDKVTYTPTGYTYSEKEILAMKEAVNNAYETPYAVTVSTYPPDKNFDPATATPEEILQYNGYDPANYTVMQIQYTDFAYYNSSNKNYKSTMYTLDNTSWNSTICDFVATPIYTKEDLPNGTVIVQQTGNMYRPEGWTELDVVNTSSTRPGNVTTNIVVVDDAWWGDWKYRAFNLAYADRTDLAASDPRSNPNQTTFCEDVKSGFAIYLPKK